MNEVAEIVAVDPESHPVLDENEVLEDPLDVLEICGSLLTDSSQDDVEIEYERGYKTRETEKTRVITLAHYSVKEYLTSARIRDGPSKAYSLQEHNSNVIIANSCVGYLLQFEDAESFCRETVETYKLARYSAEFWTHHARSYHSEEESTQKLVMKLFSNGGGAFLNWIRIYDLDRPRDRLQIGKQAAEVESPLYYASLAGLTESVRRLLHHRVANVNAQGAGRCNALQVALAHGHEAVAKLLLTAGADINAPGGEYGNALQAASTHGHERVVKLLLAVIADFNTQDIKKYLDRALRKASRRGHEAVVKLLLAAGADVNA